MNTDTSSPLPVSDERGSPGVLPILNLSPDQVLTTTRTVRKRLDYEKPVDRAIDLVTQKWTS